MTTDGAGALPRGLDRRSFLRLGATAAAAASAAPLVLGRNATATPLPRNDLFAHGVASGDPTATAVVLWTRLSPALILAGSRHVTWEVAADPAFDHVVQRGQATTDAGRDFTVQVDVEGLAPAHSYWYRFISGGTTSPVGRTKTLPGDGHTGGLRLGIVTCAELEWGYFGSYRQLAQRDDIDAVLFLGDYLYEYAAGDYGGAKTPGSSVNRIHKPDVETTTLAHYRIRHANYREDPDLQALHARHPIIAVWDDHETCNDAWKAGAENHTEGVDGRYVERFAWARQAFLEWLPLRRPAPSAEPMRIHRTVRIGDLAQLWMLDDRTYRDQHAAAAFLTLGSVDPAVDEPGRTILGDDQRNWLLDGMAASTAAWKLIGNQVPFAPYRVGPDITSPIRSQLAEASLTLPVRHPVLETDTWSGYAAEQRLIVEELAGRGVDNVVILTGDAHASYANEIPADPDTYRLDGSTVAVEFIAPSVTSPPLSTVIESQGLTGAEHLERAFEANNATANPWIKYYDGRKYGYGVLDLTEQRARYEFWHLTNPMDRGEEPAHAVSFEVDRGEAKLRQV